MTEITLRDYLAGQIINGWMSSYSADASFPVGRPELAAQVYELADIMIAVKDK